MVIDVILVFIVTSIISFAGSLQPGPINMAVLHTALTGKQKQSIIVAVGGVIPELVYSSIALWFSFLFLANEWLSNTIHILAIIFFCFAGIYLLTIKQKSVTPPKQLASNRHFILGLFAGIMNPMLFAFWVMILAVYNSWGRFNMHNIWNQTAFISGSAVGAFMLLWLIAWYAERKKDTIFKLLPVNPARITGFVFIILAVWEVVKMMR